MPELPVSRQQVRCIAWIKLIFTLWKRNPSLEVTGTIQNFFNAQRIINPLAFWKVGSSMRILDQVRWSWEPTGSVCCCYCSRGNGHGIRVAHHSCFKIKNRFTGKALILYTGLLQHMVWWRHRTTRATLHFLMTMGLFLNLKAEWSTTNWVILWKIWSCMQVYKDILSSGRIFLGLYFRSGCLLISLFQEKRMARHQVDLSSRAALELLGWQPDTSLKQAVEYFALDWELAEPPEVSSLDYATGTSDMTVGSFPFGNEFVVDHR